MPEPMSYNLFAKRGVENFTEITPTETPTTMTSTLSPTGPLLKNYNDDKVASDNKVSNPYAQGYMTSSLPEARNQDALDIQQQESALFALGAVAGVSLIVFGILITSAAQSSQ